MSEASKSPETWADEWIDDVVSGASTMSQRKLSSIEKRGGGLESVKAVAERKGVHLLLVVDEHGSEIVAASKEPFRVIC